MRLAGDEPCGPPQCLVDFGEHNGLSPGIHAVVSRLPATLNKVNGHTARLRKEIAPMPYAVVYPEHDVFQPFNLSAGTGNVVSLEIIADTLERAVVRSGVSEPRSRCGLAVCRPRIVRWR